MHVVVSSKNPVKVGAVRTAFKGLFPSVELNIEAVSIASGVADQPRSDAETRRGARNRVEAARERVPGAAFWTGLEGGIATVDRQLTAFAWMAVLGKDGHLSLVRSVSLPLPPAVEALIDEGMELGAANDRVFSTLDSKRGGGAFGLLTDGRYTREGVYAEAMTLALMPFANPLFPHTP